MDTTPPPAPDTPATPEIEATPEAIARPHTFAAHPAVSPHTVRVSAADIGTIQIAPPSFLERWGVIFLACFAFWIIVVGTIILTYYLTHQPSAPSLAGLTADQVREALANQKLLQDQWRDSLNYIFDLLITKTALPLVTLLLGYLFGKGQANS